MRIVFLGTGTSYGVPVIGCDCDVCRSDDPRNRRFRTSLYVREKDFHLVIDTPPDFREQVLRYGVERVDAVCLTHSHADHVNGFDDLRIFSYRQGGSIPVYASAETVDNMRKQFYYVFDTPSEGSTVPKVAFTAVDDPFDVGPLRLTPLPVLHGPYHAFGFRIDAGGRSVGYVPDCKEMSDEVIERLTGLDIMILDATTLKPHPTHLSLGESVDVMKRIGARRSYVTHVGHVMDHARIQSELPESFHIPYDGLAVEV